MGFAVKYDSAYEYEHVVMVSVPSTPKVVLNYSTRVAHIHCPRRLKSINNNIVAQRFVSHARPLYSFAYFVQNHQFIMHDTCNWVKILFFVLLCSPKKWWSRIFSMECNGIFIFLWLNLHFYYYTTRKRQKIVASHAFLFVKKQ